MKRHLLLTMLATSFALVMASSSAQAQKPAGPTRPAAVPEGYVITPFGYFHPFCVRGIANGDTVLADGRVQHASGATDTTAPVCSYAHYTAAGEIVKVGPVPPTITHSWIESGNSINTTSQFGELVGGRCTILRGVVQKCAEAFRTDVDDRPEWRKA